MKNLLYLLVFTILFISCEKDSLEVNNKDSKLIVESGLESFDNKSSPTCSFSGPEIVTPGTVVEYAFTHSEYSGFSIRLNGSYLPEDSPFMEWDSNFIWVSPTVSKVKLRFLPGFTCGVINFSTNDGCNLDIMVRADSACNCTNEAPARPDPIIFDSFLGSSPVNGDFCTNTTANALRVPNGDCVSDYIWSISPTVFGTDLEKSPISPNTALLKVSQPGEYVVSVKAVGENGLVSGVTSIALTAENCFGGGF
ncbi:hypothetical protein [Aquimarina algiphila]|uniref:hypothetical protein n=1 Tax=Aquimarina algiphila TaxID=2047982 RepID=UPI0024928E09|nr:hypothetical protein [Aquimarina algiphila]